MPSVKVGVESGKNDRKRKCRDPLRNVRMWVDACLYVKEYWGGAKREPVFWGNPSYSGWRSSGNATGRESRSSRTGCCPPLHHSYNLTPIPSPTLYLPLMSSTVGTGYNVGPRESGIIGGFASSPRQYSTVGSALGLRLLSTSRSRSRSRFSLPSSRPLCTTTVLRFVWVRAASRCQVPLVCLFKFVVASN